MSRAPRESALLTDVDGTIAPIVERSERARVPERARNALDALSRSLGLVACISGRSALDARQLVGLDSIAYGGNHGLELLMPGEDAPSTGIDEERAVQARGFLEAAGAGGLIDAGGRVEDKGPIQALHWRGATDEGRARAEAEEIARSAAGSGLGIHRGRRVIELRPPGMTTKRDSVAALLDGRGLRAAAYAGDDLTDLDAFAALREAVASSRLDRAVAVAIDSEEAPAELISSADVVLGCSRDWIDLLATLAGSGAVRRGRG